MDPVTIGLLIASISALVGIPSGIVAVRQLTRKKLEDELAPEKLPIPNVKSAEQPHSNLSDKVQPECSSPPNPSEPIDQISEKVLASREMGDSAQRKFFISYTSADSEKAQWIGWTLKDLGHEAYVHEWEIGAGQSIPEWMETRLDESDHLIGIFSPDYREAIYSKTERYAAFWHDPNGVDGFLLPVVVRPCELPRLVRSIKRLDLTECDKDEARHRLENFIASPTAPKGEPEFEEIRAIRKPAGPEPAFGPMAIVSDPKCYEIHRLPTPHSSELIGRTEEKALLTDEWGKRDKRNVLALIAEGGTGKSFLVSRWLAELKEKEPVPYADAQRIFTWSFYSQGSKGQVTSSEGFFSDLLRSFGEDPDKLDSLTKADKALELICNEKMILVLDGVEPLQNRPSHNDAGRFHDRTMGEFITRLACQPWPGLVIVTSRQRLVELRAYEGHAVSHVNVENLKPEDGAKLLISLGVNGPAEELEAASLEMGGHAFGLVLLGRYLVDVTGDGDIRKRDHVKLLYEQVEGAEKAKRMLKAYADQFGEGSRETAMLHLLGLFDRPVPIAALEKLVERPAIAGLTEPFDVTDAPPLAIVLKRLQDLKLITRPDTETVDGHPLVREHFGAVLEEKNPEAWKQAHSRLFDYFCAVPDKHRPDDEAGLMPLYRSLHHGVAAGRAQEALDKIYYPRISRNEEGYALIQLGLYSTELAALATYFPSGWNVLSQDLPLHSQAFLLSTAAFSLSALGRFAEAQTAYERVIDLHVKQKNAINAAISSNNLCELLTIRGELHAALARANDSVSLIDQTSDKFLQAGYRAGLAHVLSLKGNAQQAKVLFEEAEQLQIQQQPEIPYLYTKGGSHYTSFLLRTATLAALPRLTTRVQVTLEIANRHNWLLDIGLNLLDLACITERKKDKSAPGQFDAAIAALRKAGNRDVIPRGYLARAEFRRAQGDLVRAWEDLAEVRQVAKPSGMRLHLCDALIEESWLHHLAGDADEARAAFEKAQSEVNDMGYHWQDSELEKLREALDGTDN